MSSSAKKRRSEKTIERRKPTLTGNAEAVLKARYLRKDEKGQTIEEPEGMFLRVAEVVAGVEKSYGLSPAAIETVREEFYDLMVSGRFMPNSPTLMNAGREMGMLSACFVLPVEDSIDGIFSSIKRTAMIQKAGGGTGFSFSRLRPEGDIVKSSGGTTSGPISFMKVFSEATQAIQQGAFRRGANMGMMRVDHPDIAAFIRVKEDLTTLTNFNLSVAVTDAFMKALKENPDHDHIVTNPRTGESGPLAKGEEGGAYSVGEIFEQVVQKAWQSGEPGVVFIDTMNKANPTPHIGAIEATNPCGEQPLLPYESCNLGSVNLASFIAEREGKTAFNKQAYRQTIKLATRFLDNVIDVNNYPIPEVDAITKANRKIGLGVMGFADALFHLGIPYNSEAGLAFAEEAMSILQDESHKASQLLAEERGTFPNWKGSVWSDLATPMRNAATTTVAPTGTISIIADTSGGIEPLFSLAFLRNILDGQQFIEVNTAFESLAKEQGFYSDELMSAIAKSGSIQNLDGIPEAVKEIYVTSRDISPEWHVRMQAAFQKYCDSSISKTINFPAEAGAESIGEIFQLAHELGCKGITVYRDGCRDNQPMALAAETKKAEGKKSAKPVFTRPVNDGTTFVRPMHLPDILSAVRIKQITPFGHMHIKIVIDPVQMREREVFATLGKGGDVACSDLEAICRLISMYLRVNGSLEDVIKQLDGIGSSLTIPTKDGRIASLADAIAKAIQKYVEAKKSASIEDILLGRFDINAMQRGLKSMGKAANGDENLGGAFKVKCPECTGNLVFEEGCTKCPGCGYSKC
ncbi:MAG: vitamin B12-dependent ribonucleotide reductase [Planctomycetota bacterium]|jgi:ribonucleoside-diphosphate reductase alpha chain